MGQSMFNAIFDVDSEFANKIAGTEYDCYFRDNISGMLLDMFYKEYSE